MARHEQNSPPSSRASATVEWWLAALGAVICFALPVLILSSPPSLAGATMWPLPGLILLEIALLGLAGFAGIASDYGPQALRGPTAAWMACGALAALGVIGTFGVSVIVFALLPATFFGLTAALADWRLRRGWRAGLGTWVLSAGVNAVLVFVLISLPKGS